jgi:hypothetical protein
MLDLTEIKNMHDRAYVSNQDTRKRASEDMVFYFITHWDSAALRGNQTSYRGEFDLLKKGGRQIISDLALNPVQIDLEPINETRTDAADLADGMYRTDDNNNQSIEAYENGKLETVVCGYGAWKLYTEYVTLRTGSKNQIIKRKPIYEANNTVFWDPDAHMLDKSDAEYVSAISAYTPERYKKLVSEMTGEPEKEINPSSFTSPEISYTFPWFSTTDFVYVSEFYHLEEVKSKIYTLINYFNEIKEISEKDFVEDMDSLIDEGYEVVDTKETLINQVTRYIASGEAVLDTAIISGQHIPIVPMYGEHSYVEDEEHYEGMVNCAKDPQRLRDFGMSYVSDIVSRSPRPKPIFGREQVAGYEDMYEEAGADNNYAYYFMNMVDDQGKPLPLAPLATMPEQPIPQGLMALLGLTREAVDDVANAGIPKDALDSDLAENTLMQLQNRLDMQSLIYQQHYKHAKRRDAEVWVSIASEIYDTNRKVKVTLPDKSRKDVVLMEEKVDEETGEVVVTNDLRNAEFEVYSEIGPSYSTQKEQTVDKLGKMIATMDPGDPIRKVLQLKQLMLMDGVDFDDVRDYVKQQLLAMGIRKPETPEEKMFVQQIQSQPKEPDAATLLSMAEMKKAEAIEGKNQVAAMDVQLKAQNEGMKRMIDEFKAMTDRMNMQIDAQEASANISNKDMDTASKQLDNASKMIEIQTPDLSQESDENLFAMVAAG